MKLEVALFLPLPLESILAILIVLIMQFLRIESANYP